MPGEQHKPFLRRLWSLACSLKLAIALATAATILIMGGSLIMHFNPAIFGGMEQEIMARWLPQAWSRAPHLVFWVPLCGLFVLLFGINTLCCSIDWLTRIRSRWRKAGEYLIHTGFILLLVAYLWGSIGGFRSGPYKIFPGERLTIPEFSDYTLQLDEFTPRLEPSGRPLDMINQVSLWKGSEQVTQAQVRINHPLIHDGLVILPTSFGQDLTGFRFNLQGRGLVELRTGTRLSIPGGKTILTRKLLPDARRGRQGRVIQVGGYLNNPAIQISIENSTGQLWEGWYFLREPLPQALRKMGVMLRPVEPIHKTYSLLTINRDPGDKLALGGALCISIGVFFAFFSFYRKRSQGDRPEV